MVLTSSNPYEVLGVSEDAAAGDIRKAYRMLALRWHPDKSPPEERDAAEQAFKDLGGAYEILRDPARRREYDTARRSQTPTLQRRRGSSCSAAMGAQGRSRARTAPQQDTRSASGGPAWTPPPSWWFASTAPAPGSGFGFQRPAAQKPGSARVWFARGSACVGRAYKGQEVEALANVRQMTLEAIGQWASSQPAARIDIRGCSQKGEVAPRQLEALGLSRCEKTLAFFTARCGVPAEQCHASRRLGEDFQGVEIRAMTRLDVDGAFEGGSSAELRGGATLGVVAAATLKSPVQHLLLEVLYTGGERLAQRRSAALRRALASLGVPQHRICSRVRAGLSEEAAFLLYEELSPLDET